MSENKDFAAMAEAAIKEIGFSLPSPLRDKNVVLLHVPWHFETTSGLEIHHSETLPPIWGVIVMVGKSALGLQYGDHVRFKRHSGEEISWRGKQYWLHHMDDIEAVLLPDENPPNTGDEEENANVDPA